MAERVFWQGILAGYGIAIPVGAIAVLIVERGLRRGFWSGFAAGAGAATADFLYACLAALAGQALVAALIPFAGGIRLLSAGMLIGLGIWGLRGVLLGWRKEPSGPNVGGIPLTVGQTYAQFVGLTLLNPLTVAYFAALILGGSAELNDWTARAAFVAGAGLASLSWQSLLAGMGALGHRHLSPGIQRAASLASNLIVLLLGVRMLLK